MNDNNPEMMPGAFGPEQKSSDTLQNFKPNPF